MKDDYLNKLDAFKKHEKEYKLNVQDMLNQIHRHSKLMEEERQLKDLKNKAIFGNNNDTPSETTIDEIKFCMPMVTNEDVTQEEIDLFLKNKEQQFSREYAKIGKTRNYDDVSISGKAKIGNIEYELKMNFDISFLDNDEYQIKTSMLKLYDSFIEELLKIKHERMFDISQEDLDKYEKSAAMPDFSHVNIEEVVKFLEIYKKEKPNGVSNKEDKLFNMLNK